MKYILPAISIIILIAVIAWGAFYFGQKSTGSSSIGPTPTISPVNSTINTTTTSVTSAPTSGQPQTTTISGGGVLSFSSYSLNMPSGWASQREQGQDNDKLTLTKDGYSIVIFEAAFGGGGCIYPGDPPSEMAQTFSSFIEINNTNGFVFRRSSVDAAGKSAFAVCQKNTTDGSFGSPTQFGAISISGPLNPSNSILAEVDSILASIKK